MNAMITKILSLVLLLLFAITPLACLNSGSDQDRQRDEPRKETTVGGDKGIVVEHGGGQGTEVKIGGDKGIVVGH